MPPRIDGRLGHMPANQRSFGRTTEGAPLDDTNRRLLAELQDDARLSLAELGRRVGLSSPAVAERLARLESERLHHRLPHGHRREGARLQPQRGHPHPAGVAPAATRRRARAHEQRGRRVPPRHRRGLLLREGARPLDRAPRGADRPLHPVRPDDDLDHPVVAGPAARARRCPKARLTPAERPHSGRAGHVKPPLRIGWSSAERASIAALAKRDRTHTTQRERTCQRSAVLSASTPRAMAVRWSRPPCSR